MDQVYNLSRGFLVALPEAVEAALPEDRRWGQEAQDFGRARAAFP